MDLVEELQKEVAENRLICIVGAGVSIAASYDPDRKPNVASWVGLLEDGIARCTEVASDLPVEWADRWRDILKLGEKGDGESLLSVAEQITVRLGGPSGGELKRWLRDTAGSLRTRHPEVPRALAELGVPLLTTNYDDILEEVTSLKPIDWSDTANVVRVLRGETNAILHLHGHWNRSENLVLGVRSYEQITRDPKVQATLRTLLMTKTVLFIGYGAGLDDPNFGALRRWWKDAFASSETRHYRLALRGEQAKTQAQYTKGENVLVVPYGDKHADLAPFLAKLSPKTRRLEKQSGTRPPVTDMTEDDMGDGYPTIETSEVSAAKNPSDNKPTTSVRRQYVEVLDRFPIDEFVSLLNGARRLRILQTFIPMDAHMYSFKDELTRSLRAGCEVHVLLCNPWSPICQIRQQALSGKHTTDVRNAIERNLHFFHDVFERLANDARPRLRVKVYSTLPSMSIYQIDNIFICGNYFHGWLAIDSPQIKVTDHESKLGRRLGGELDTLWRQASESASVDLSDVDNWLRTGPRR